MEIVFDVDGVLFAIDEDLGTLVAEQLRLKAIGMRGDYGVDRARDVADAIEDVLVGRTSDPLRLDPEGAEAVFYVLNISLMSTARDHPAFALYHATRAVHERRLGEES